MTKNTTPTNEAGHGLPELPEPDGDMQGKEYSSGCYESGYTADQMRQYARDALALSRGVPESGRYFVDGPQGSFFTSDKTFADLFVREVDDPDDWTITDLSNPTETAPAAAGAQGEDALTIPYERHECEILKVIDQRDRYHEIADDLASQIASITGADIGEHSSANCPWMEALQAADDYIARQAPQPAAADGGVRERARAIFDAMLAAPYGSTTMGDIVCAETTCNRLESAWLPILEAALSSHRQAGDGQDG